MATQTNKIFVQQNGERVEATGETLEYILSWQAEVAEQERLMKQEEAAKASAKQALLDRLGITVEEAKLLLS